MPTTLCSYCDSPDHVESDCTDHAATVYSKIHDESHFGNITSCDCACIKCYDIETEKCICPECDWEDHN